MASARGTSWSDLRERFTRVVFRRGVKRVAADMPADPKTVYRIVNGKIGRPHLATKAAIERLVEEEESKQ